MHGVVSSGYKPELDGLRALALSFVVLEHSFKIFHGGFIGVDLFFVLSGYLITSILTRELRETNRISLPNFYVRRFVRLTPALFTMLAVYLAGTLAYVLWSHKSAFGQTHFWALSAAATYLMNWNLAFEVGPPGFLEHTWSLGIEEQFYLLWPLLLIIAARWLDRTKLALLCLALILMCNGWRAYLWTQHPPEHRIYMGLDTRIDGLLVGCLLALWPISRRMCESIAKFVLIPVTAMLLALAFMQWDSTVYKLGSGLIALCAAWIIIAVLTNRESLLANLLRLRSMTYLGRISYGCYLWHYPAYLVLGWFMPASIGGRAALATGLTLAAAASSYHLIEIPMQRLRPVPQRARPAP